VAEGGFVGFLSSNWEEVARNLRAAVEPHLQPGEQLIGVVHANEPKTFSAKFYAIGVTPDRLVLLPLNRKMAPSGDPPVSIARGDIVNSSVWGWGGSVRDWLSATSDQQIRIQTSSAKYKLMMLGGNLLENTLAGDDQLSGLDALVAFLQSAKAGGE
jgi:hypothetical protein